MRLSAVKDLDGEEVAMPMPGESAYFDDLFVSRFFAADISVRRGQYLSRMHTVMTFVRAGAALGLVPESAVELVAKGVEVRRLLPKNCTRCGSRRRGDQ